MAPNCSTGKFLSPATSPTTLQGLCQGLFSLLPWVQLHTEEGKLLTQVIHQVRTGSCGEMQKASIESEFNASLVSGDIFQTIRDALVLEALGKCMENSTDADRRWLLVNSLEVGSYSQHHWPGLICVPPLGTMAHHTPRFGVFTCLGSHTLTQIECVRACILLTARVHIPRK